MSLIFTKPQSTIKQKTQSIQRCFQTDTVWTHVQQKETGKHNIFSNNKTHKPLILPLDLYTTMMISLNHPFSSTLKPILSAPNIPLLVRPGLAASLTAVGSALQHSGATDTMHATSEYLASGIGALTVRRGGDRVWVRWPVTVGENTTLNGWLGTFFCFFGDAYSLYSLPIKVFQVVHRSIDSLPNWFLWKAGHQKKNLERIGKKKRT